MQGAALQKFGGRPAAGVAQHPPGAPCPRHLVQASHLGCARCLIYRKSAVQRIAAAAGHSPEWPGPV